MDFFDYFYKVAGVERSVDREVTGEIPSIEFDPQDVIINDDEIIDRLVFDKPIGSNGPKVIISKLISYKYIINKNSRPRVTAVHTGIKPNAIVSVEVDPQEKYKPLAIAVGNEFKKYYNTDLYDGIDSEALYSLSLALKSFNPINEEYAKEYWLRKYIIRVVKNNVIDFIYDHTDTFGVSTRMHSLDKKIRNSFTIRVVKLLTEYPGVNYETVVKLAILYASEKHKVSEKKVLAAFNRQTVISLDNKKEACVYALKNTAAPDDSCDNDIYIDPESDLGLAINTLKKSEREVLELYHEIGGRNLSSKALIPKNFYKKDKNVNENTRYFKEYNYKITFEMIGKHLKIPTSTVRERYERAIEKIRQWYAENRPEYYSNRTSETKTRKAGILDLLGFKGGFNMMQNETIAIVRVTPSCILMYNSITKAANDILKEGKIKSGTIQQVVGCINRAAQRSIIPDAINKYAGSHWYYDYPPQYTTSSEK